MWSFHQLRLSSFCYLSARKSEPSHRFWDPFFRPYYELRWSSPLHSSWGAAISELEAFQWRSMHTWHDSCGNRHFVLCRIWGSLPPCVSVLQKQRRWWRFWLWWLYWCWVQWGSGPFCPLPRHLCHSALLGHRSVSLFRQRYEVGLVLRWVLLPGKQCLRIEFCANRPLGICWSSTRLASAHGFSAPCELYQDCWYCVIVSFLAKLISLCFSYE